MRSRSSRSFGEASAYKRTEASGGVPALRRSDSLPERITSSGGGKCLISRASLISAAAPLAARSVVRRQVEAAKPLKDSKNSRAGEQELDELGRSDTGGLCIPAVFIAWQPPQSRPSRRSACAFGPFQRVDVWAPRRPLTSRRTRSNSQDEKIMVFADPLFASYRPPLQPPCRRRLYAAASEDGRQHRATLRRRRHRHTAGQHGPCHTRQCTTPCLHECVRVSACSVHRWRRHGAPT